MSTSNTPSIVSFPSVARTTGTTLAASGAVLLLVAVANVLIGRTLGPDGQGRVAAATLIPMIVAYAGELGIPVATGYLINQSPDRRNATIASARYLCAVLAMTLTVLAGLLIALVPLPSGVKPVSLVFCLFISLNLFHRLHLTILQSEMRMAAFNGIRVVGAAVYPSLLLLYALTGTSSVLGVVIALLLANVVWCSLSTWRAASRPAWRYHRGTVRALFRYGVPAHVGSVSSVETLKLDQLVLALFLGTDELGLYVAAMTIITGNRVIGYSVGMVCFPMASRGEGARSAKAGQQLGQLLVVTLGLATLVALLEVAFGEILLRALFGRDFEPGTDALRILAVGSVFMNLRQPCAEWVRGCGRPGVAATAELAGVASLLILSALLWDGSIVRVAWIVTISAAVSFFCLPMSVLRTLRVDRASVQAPAR